MKNWIIVLLATSVTACSVNLRKGKSAPVFEKSEVISNEFVFAGNAKAVQDYLTAAGIEATFIPINAETSTYQVKYKGDLSLDVLSAELEKKVDYIEPNFAVKLHASQDRYSWPTDRLFFKQWALNNIGQSPPFGLPGTEGADMDMLNAWKISKGSKDVVVAVIDTGVDYTHPDLKDNMWVNFKESEQGGGIPGVDDDGNGYVDDVYGYDFASVGRLEYKGNVPGDSDPMDEGGHGTHCAGSIGAMPNNAVGVAGVNWNVRIMAVRFLSEAGGSSSDAARAIYYAIKNKADVMSNSWGGGAESKLIRKAIADAQKAGILFVAAAGNDGANNDVKPSYPASYNKDEKDQPLNNVLAVGASDNQDNPAEFSNYGHEKVHVFAPGVNILSTYPVKMATSGRPWAVMSGTSMATPYVAGVAALMIAANPSLRGKPEEIKNILMQTSDVRPSLVGKSASNGRINAYRALQAKAGGQDLSPKWVTQARSVNHRSFTRDLVDIREEIKVANAKAIRVHFDFIQVQEPYDSIYVYDRNFTLIAHVEETESRDHWSAVIPGDTVIVRYANSLVKQIKMTAAAPQPSEAACMSLGALDVQPAKDGQYTCMVDSEDSSGDNSKTYSSFNSEGYSIDQVSYIPGQGAKQ